MGARKMVKLKVIETSGVDHPAHLNEGWVVMKHDDQSETSEGETEMTEEQNTDVLAESLVKAQERIAELETELETLRVEPTEVAEVAPTEEDIMKSVPEVVRVALEKARTDADEARTELRKEREARLDAQFVQKARDEWSHLTLDAELVGKAMRRLTETDAELAEVIEKALTSVNAQAESADIFAEIGTVGRPDNSSTLGKVQSLAKSLVADGKAKTVEQAVADLISTDPSLYHDYLAEQRG